MKITNFFKSRVFMLSFLIGGFFLLQGCSSNGSSTPALNKSALTTAVATATTTLSAAVEGNAQGQYVTGSKATLSTALGLANGVLTNTASTQVMLDSAVVALNQALTAFAAQTIVPIDPTNLVGQWTFDDGSGTTVKDFSGNNFTGTFGSTTGIFKSDGVTRTDGTVMPTWTADRHGNANKAILFNNGSKITVPYNAILNPSIMSVSVWIRLDEARADNRFMGLNSWNGFKFQTQSGNLPFFTGGGIDHDDAGTALVVGTWYNLAVTTGNGHMIFYINGNLIKDWDLTPQSGAIAKVISGQDLVFGVDASTYTTDSTSSTMIFQDWAGFLHGALDEVRIYKSALSAVQVKGIYDAEK